MMLIEALLSVIIFMMFVMYIVNNKRIKALKDRDQWKANYFACKSVLDLERNKPRK